VVSAGLGAGAVGIPIGHFAVSWAALVVAGALLSQGAFVATVLGSGDGVVFPHLGTTTAGGAASTPGEPGVLAVSTARVRVARGFTGKRRAGSTVVCGVNEDGAEALLDASTAAFGASLPGLPLRHLAVHRLGSGRVGGCRGWLVGLHTDGASVPVSRQVEADRGRIPVVAKAVGLSTGELGSEVRTVFVQNRKFGLDGLGIGFVHGTEVHPHGDATVDELLSVLHDLITLGPLEHALGDGKLFSKQIAQGILLVPVEGRLSALGRSESD
jgi:hypothetical protein